MRASLNPDKAAQGSGGGIEAGNYQVESAVFKNIKTDFKPKQPAMVFGMTTLDKDGDPVRGADPVEMTLSFGEKAGVSFHPGKIDGPEADTVEDQGDDIDAEGNTLYIAADGAEINKSCGAMVFMESLVKLGVPKALLDRCYAPDFEGMKFSLETRTPEKINEWLGTRLNTRPPKDSKDGGGVITYKVATKLLNPKHFSSNGAGGSKATAKAEAPAEAKPTDPEEIAKAVLARVAAAKAGDKNKIKTKAALIGFFTNEYTKGKFDAKQLGKAQGFVKNEEWITEAVAELGGSIDEGVTTFPDAE